MVLIDTTPQAPQTPQHAPTAAALAGALSAESSSVRLQAALAAGSYPDPALVGPLVDRCAVEPELFVRDTLSWALMRLPARTTLPRLRYELGSESPQARRQALHTLSKIGDGSAYPWITREMLREDDEDLARTAWRAAVVLVPDDQGQDLAAELVTQLGRGDHEVRLSLSRALVGLGEVAAPALERAAASADRAVAAHARATTLLLEEAADEARRAAEPGRGRAAAPPRTGQAPRAGDPTPAPEVTGR